MRSPEGRVPAFWPLSFLTLGTLFYGPLRMRRRGVGNLPRGGGLLVVCNHVSVADPAALMITAWPRRRLRMMAKAELFRIPVFRAYLRGLGAFPVVRDSADHGAMRTARRLLEAGEAVGVFPEGRVSRSGHLGPGGAGVGLLAVTAGVTVIPAAVWGTQRFRGPVRVRYGPPLDLSDLEGPRAARSRAAAERIMAALAALVPTVGGPVQDPPAAAPAAAAGGGRGGRPLLP